MPVMASPRLTTSGPVGAYHGYTQANPYWIRLSELRTAAGLAHWISHLETKGWWYEGTNRADFLRAVHTLCANGYDYRGKHHDVGGGRGWGGSKSLEGGTSVKPAV